MKVKLPAAFAPLLTENARYKVFYGGRGGAKSRSFGTALLIRGREKKTRILCGREIQKSIKDSVKAVLDNAIIQLGFESFYRSTETKIEGKNGTTIIFSGFRTNPENVKSYEAIDICWIEEASRVSQRSIDLVFPTIRNPNSEIWISFNPDMVEDPIYQMFVANTPPPRSIVTKVNYDSNPFFPDVLRQDMNWMKEKDYEKYLHVWEGETRENTEEQVFFGYWKVEETPEPTDEDVLYFGADFGFSQDASTLIRCWVKDRKLIIDYESYGIGVEIDNLPSFYSKVPGYDRWSIYADNSRPETISHLKKKHKLKIFPVTKGPGSIEDGIEYMKSFDQILIHPRCKETISEFKFYSYKIDPKTDEITPIIVDKFNHCIDAIRYSLEKLMKTSKKAKVRFRRV